MADQLTTEQIAEFKEAFSLFDKEKKNRIPLSDLPTLVRILNHNPSEAELKEMAMECDQDGGGTVTFSEFLNVMSKRVQLPEAEEEIKEAFRLFGKADEETGELYIDGESLRKVLTQMGEPMEDEDVDELMREADADGDAKFDYGEFIKLVFNRDMV